MEEMQVPTSTGGASAQLVIRVVGLRLVGGTTSSGAVSVRCKLSLRNVLFKTPYLLMTPKDTTRNGGGGGGGDGTSASNDTSTAGASREGIMEGVFEEAILFCDWGLVGPESLSSGELLVVRVQALDEAKRIVKLKYEIAAASIALKTTANFGSGTIGIWFPLSPFSGAGRYPGAFKFSSGQVQLQIYWSREVLRTDPLEGHFKIAKPAKRKLYFLGHETQETLVSQGVNPIGLNPLSSGVEVVDFLGGDYRRRQAAEARDAAQNSPAHHQDHLETRSVESTRSKLAQFFCLPFDRTRKNTAQNVENEVVEESELSEKRSHFRGVQKNEDILEHVSTKKRPALIIRLIKGRGLLAADPDGFSDPFAIVTLKSKTQKTEIVYKNLEPVWNETLVFGGDDDQDEYICYDDAICILIKDYDYLKPADDLGMNEFVISQIFEREGTSTKISQLSSQTRGLAPPNANGGKNLEEQDFLSSSGGKLIRNTGEIWVRLSPIPGMATVRGDIKIEVTFVPASNPMAFLTPEIHERSRRSRRGSGEDDTTLGIMNISPFSVVHGQYPEFTPLYKYTVRTRPILRVWIIQARGLKKMDIVGKSDPYCVLRCRGHERHTEVKYVNLNPFWGEIFEFGGELDYLLESDSIRIEVYDKDTISSDDLIGFIEFPIWAVLSRKFPEWFTLRGPDDPAPACSPSSALNPRPFFGEIRVKFEYLRPPVQNPLPAKKKDETPPGFQDELDSGLLTLNKKYLDSQNLSSSWDVIRSGTRPKVLSAEEQQLPLEKTTSTSIQQLPSTFRLGQEGSASEGGTIHRESDLGGLPYAPARQVLSRVPSFRRYRGRIWQYEIQCSILKGRKFIVHKSIPRGRIFCSVRCGKQHSKRTTGGVENLPEPVWYDDATFTFKETDSPFGDLPGVRRYDTLTISVHHSSDPNRIIGILPIDIAVLEDRLGYIDLDGSKLTDWFSIQSVSEPNKRHSHGRPRLSDSETDPARDPGEENSQRYEIGQLLVTFSLKPIRQTRFSEKRMLSVKLGTVDDLFVRYDPPQGGYDSLRSSLSRNHGDNNLDHGDLISCNFVYALVRYGVQVQRTCTVRRYPSGVASFNELFLFETLDDKEFPGTSKIPVTVSIFDDVTNLPLGSFSVVVTSLEQAPCRRMCCHVGLQDDHHLHDNRPIPEDEEEKVDEEKGEADDDDDDDSSELDDDDLVSGNTGHQVRTDLVKQPHPFHLLHHPRGLPTLMNGSSATIKLTRGPSVLGPEGKPSANLSFDARLINVELPISPILGVLNVHLRRIKLLTEELHHDIRCVLSLGGFKVATMTYLKRFNLMFPEKDSFFQFPVQDPYSVLEIEVKDLTGVSSLSLDEGTTISKLSLSLLELIEYDAQKLFRGWASRPGLNGSRVAPPTVMKFQLPKPGTSDRNRGFLSMELFYDNSTSGVLASNANPKPKPLPKVTPEAFGFEMKRFRDILGWALTFSQNISAILNWSSPPFSMATLCVAVFVCLLDFWTSRFLVMIPAFFLLHIMSKFVQRMDGRFIASFIKRSTDTGELDVKARLRLSVLKGSQIPNLYLPIPKRPTSDTGMWRPGPRRAKGHLSLNSKAALMKKEVQPQMIAKILLLPAISELTMGSSLGTMQEIGSMGSVDASSEPNWANSENRLKIANGSVGISWRMGKDLDFAKIPAFLRLVERKAPKTRLLVIRVLSGKSSGPLAPAGLMPKQLFCEVMVQSVEDALVSRERAVGSIASAKDDGQRPAGTLTMFSAMLPTSLGRGSNSRNTVRTRYTKRYDCQSGTMFSIWNEQFVLGMNQIIESCDVLEISLKGLTRKRDRVKNVFGPIGGVAESPEEGMSKMGDIGSTMQATETQADLDLQHSSSSASSTAAIINVGMAVVHLSEIPVEGQLRKSVPLLRTSAAAPGEGEEVGQIEIELGWLGTEHHIVQAPSSSGSSAVNQGGSLVPDRSEQDDDEEMFEDMNMNMNMAELENEESGENMGNSHFYSWKAVESCVVIDVFEEEPGTSRHHRKFCGRALLPISDLITDSSCLDQPLLNKTIPLTLRFDGSQEDLNLYVRSCADQLKMILNENKIKGAMMRYFVGYLDSIQRADSTQHPVETFLELKLNVEKTLREMKEVPSDESSSPTTGIEALELLLERLTQARFDVVGRVHICGQLTLPDSKAEERLQKAKESKKASKKGIKASYNMMMREVNWFYTQLAQFNDTMERVKNVLNWSHPAKTRIILLIFLTIFCMFLFLPSRVIVLFLIIFFYTEHFRPLGTMSLKAKHLLATVPTDDEISRVLSSSTMLMQLADHTNSDSNDDTWNRLGMDQDHISLAAAQKKLEVTFLGKLRDRFTSNDPATGKSSLEGPQINLMNVSISGHLHVLHRGHRLFETPTAQWKRQYFCIHKNEILCWAHKEDAAASMKPRMVYSKIIDAYVLRDRPLEAMRALGDDYDSLKSIAFAVVCAGKSVESNSDAPPVFSLFSRKKAQPDYAINLQPSASSTDSAASTPPIAIPSNNTATPPPIPSSNAETPPLSPPIHPSRTAAASIPAKQDENTIYFLAPSHSKRDKWVAELTLIKIPE